MKKVISLLVSAVLMLALLPVGAYAAFPDMAETHWAYASVEKLVNSGTINGMPDGTFSPAGVVSRAEFVKMLGKSTKKFEKNFADVPETHWAYDYIMYSELEGDENGKFNPSATITRGEVANLLYKRYANGAQEIAPYYISSQGNNTNAVAWVYNTGLMIGADKLNLRLDDTLTRAEAAVLIVRAKELKPDARNNFIDNFESEVYKNMYEGSCLFDTPYEENGNITYEELATAAMRLEYKYRTPAIQYSYDAKYEGRYAVHWDIACRYALDEKNYGSTKENADKYVTTEDAIAMLSLAAMNSKPQYNLIDNIGTTVHPGVVIKDNNSEFAKRMFYAYQFGISLYADENIKPKNIITKKELACILMQYALSLGTETAYHCGYNAGYIPIYPRIDAASYPAEASEYSLVADSIPNFVYEKPYTSDKAVNLSPKEFASHGAMAANIYSTMFMYFCAAAYEKGAEVYIDYYPSLALRYEDMSVTFRVKFSVNNAPEGMKLSDVIALGSGVADRALLSGESFWCDISSNQPTVGKLYIDYTLMTVDQIIG